MAKHIIISTSVDLIRVASEDLVYITSDGNYSSLFFVDSESRVVTMQLGTLEALINNQLGKEGSQFIRIGRSHIINRNFITYINISKQQFELSDHHRFTHLLNASKDSLKQLKELIEKE